MKLVLKKKSKVYQVLVIDLGQLFFLKNQRSFCNNIAYISCYFVLCFICTKIWRFSFSCKDLECSLVDIVHCKRAKTNYSNNI